jgi:hypothetical protein
MIIFVILINAVTLLINAQSLQFQKQALQGVPLNSYCVRLLNDRDGSVGCQGEERVGNDKESTGIVKGFYGK